MQFDRRSLLMGGPAALLATASPSLASTSDRPALRTLAAQKGLIIGSAMAATELNTEDRALFAAELSGITPENALKMSSLRPTRDVWRFAQADAIVDFATKAGLRVRGHTLIWNNDQQPKWIASLSEPALIAAMQEHIERTITRYADRIRVWDVINEPIGEKQVGKLSLRDGPFLARLGPRYIARSFRMARAVSPSAKLVLNETHTERGDRYGETFRRNLLLLIDQLQDQGVPLDGVGLQGHLRSDVSFNPDTFAAFLDQIEKRKLFIEITELDVNDISYPDDIEARDRAVAGLYRDYLTIALANRAVKSLTFWQLGDKESWYFANSIHQNPGALRRPRPLLFDLRMRPKPALFTVLDALRNMPSRG